jgi:hypothetical protein
MMVKFMNSRRYKNITQRFVYPNWQNDVGVHKVCKKNGAKTVEKVKGNRRTH